MRKNWTFEESRTLIANYKQHEVRCHGWGRYARLLDRGESSVRAQYNRLKNLNLHTLELFNAEFGSSMIGKMPSLDNYKKDITTPIISAIPKIKAEALCVINYLHSKGYTPEEELNVLIEAAKIYKELVK